MPRPRAGETAGPLGAKACVWSPPIWGHGPAVEGEFGGTGQWLWVCLCLISYDLSPLRAGTSIFHLCTHSTYPHPAWRECSVGVCETLLKAPRPGFGSCLSRNCSLWDHGQVRPPPPSSCWTNVSYDEGTEAQRVGRARLMSNLS